MLRKFIGAIAMVIVIGLSSQIGKLGGRKAVDEVSRQTLSVSQVEAYILKLDNNDIFLTIKKHFPEDYDLLVRDFQQLIKSSQSNKAARYGGAQIVSKLRRKYAPYIVKAPDEDLQVYLSNYISLVENIYEHETALNCTQFVAMGPQSLNPDIASKYSKQLSQSGAIAFEAMSAGYNASSHSYEPASDDDWNAVIENAIELGLNEEHGEILDSQDYSNPELCPAMIAFYKGFTTQNSDSAKRVRAEVALILAGG